MHENVDTLLTDAATSAPAAAPAAPAQSTAQPQVNSQEQAAEALYGDPTITHRQALSLLEQANLDRLQTPDQAKAGALQWAPTFKRFGIVDSTAVADAIISATKTAPDAGQVNSWMEQSRAHLRQEYGDQAGVALQRAQKFLDADPKFKSYLKSTGLSNHPTLVRELAASAQRAFMSGKLR